MITYFKALGDRIATEWRAANRDDRAFVSLAERALMDAPPHEHVTADAVLEWLLRYAPSGSQPGMHLFGQPPVEVYRGVGFRLEVLFWREATTSIHQHAFSGAFTILAGESLHSTFAFQESRRINARLRIGELTRKSVERLSAGEVRAIWPGQTFIHQVFHLSDTTVTVVARTDGLAEYRPQFRYEFPGVAAEPEEDPLTSRRLAALSLIADRESGQIVSLCATMMRELDAENACVVLMHLAPRVTPAVLEEIAEAGRGHLGALVPVFLEAGAHRRRVHAALRSRASIRNSELRFVTALLMLGQTKQDIAKLLEVRASGENSDEFLVASLSRLAETGALDVEFDEVNRDIVRSIVRGASPLELLDALSSVYDPDDLLAQRDEILQHTRRMFSTPLLSPLLPSSWQHEEGRIQ